MNNWKVIKGIFKGHEFNGKPLNGRIIDLDSAGQSFPIENCIKLNGGKSWTK